jgi:hypothetical protein
MINRNRPTGQAGECEAWMHLVRINRKLAELEKLAASDRMQDFVWELNDFVSSARKVTNYLRSEPGRGKGFRQWVDDEFIKLRDAEARFRFFLDLRNISDKDCAIVPQMSGIHDEVVAVVDLSKETELKHPETGETIAIFHRQREGVVIGDKISVHKRKPIYTLEEWPDEDIFTFLKAVIASLEDFVSRAYSAFPNPTSEFLKRSVVRSV